MRIRPIPSVREFPILTDEERATVGRIYKRRLKQAEFLLGPYTEKQKFAMWWRVADGVVDARIPKA